MFIIYIKFCQKVRILLWNIDFFISQMKETLFSELPREKSTLLLLINKFHSKGTC